MRNTKIIIAAIGLAAVAGAGGVTAALAGTSPASGTHSARQSSAATVRTALATVEGKTETILVNGRGVPLYYYRPDTATRSLVTGGLLALWPAVTSTAPTAGAGVNGKLTVLSDAHGQQVTYNGHLLYTFVDDQADRVTGQGVSDFFVATPGLAPITGSPEPAGPVPAAPSGGSYGY